MSTVAASPIAGVTPNRETLIEEVWPSVAKTGPGRLIGNVCNCIPVKINGVLISQLLFGLPMGGIGALIYLWMKVFDKKYALTNRSVKIRAALGDRLYQQVALTDVASITIAVRPGQEFHKAADLELRNAGGDVIMVLEGVVRPDRFRQIILDAREARIGSDASLATINARSR